MKRLDKRVSRVAAVGRDEVVFTMDPRGFMEMRVLRCRRTYTLPLQHIFDRAVKAVVMAGMPLRLKGKVQP
jgi:hypothetical protein